MNYKLALELKDAGFPQDNTRWSYCKSLGKPSNLWKKGTWHIQLDSCEENYANSSECYAWPTLEELIDACGGEFDRLKYNIDKKGVFWKAWGITKKGIEIEEAKTPLEAVAKLFIKLNK